MLRGLVGVADLDDIVLEPIVGRRVDAIRRSLQGFSKAQPLALAADLVESRLLMPHVSNDEKMAALEAVTLARLREFCRDAFGVRDSIPTPETCLRATAFLYGNADSDDVAAVRGVVSSVLSIDADIRSPEVDSGGASPASQSPESFCTRAFLLPAGTSSTEWMPHTNPQEINAGLVLVWQIGVRTPRNVAVGQLLSSEEWLVPRTFHH